MGKLPLKTVIFDFGGVILRSLDRSPRTAWDEHLGLSTGQFEDYIFNGPTGRKAQVGQATWEEVWAEAAKHFSLADHHAAQAQRDFFKGDAIDQDLVRYIRRLKQHFAIGLLSNTWYPDGVSLLIQYGLADAFNYSVTSAEVGVMKPDPKIYQVALSRAGAEPAEAVFVDDFEENVLAARDLGMQAVYFVDPTAAHARLAELTGIE
jgi:putative hydrolase of the HAD superfamily